MSGSHIVDDSLGGSSKVDAGDGVRGGRCGFVDVKLSSTWCG